MKSASFLRAQVAWFDDEGGEPGLDQLRRLQELHARMTALTGAEAQPADPSQPAFSFELAAALPLDLDFKQALLGMRSEAARLKHFLEYYEAVLPRLERVVKAQRKAGGNGHV
jgi:hypothetical protein